MGVFGDKEFNFPKYKLTNFGNIINKEGVLLTPQIINGYLHIQIGVKKMKIHRCVAFFFVNGRTEEKKYVHHKDEDRLNPHYSNLEWVTLSENANYSKRNEISVDQFNLEGKFLKRFRSITAAIGEIAHESGAASSISNVCKTKEGTAYDFIWRFADLSTEIPADVPIPKKITRAKAVDKYVKGDLIKSYSSIREAAEDNEETDNTVGRCCRGETKKTRKGNVYKFSSILYDSNQT